MVKKASYILSVYSFISTYSLDELLNIGYQLRKGGPIPSFDENLLIDLCSEAQKAFENEENILKIDGDIIIVGDLHGNLHDLLRIMKFVCENKSKVLFLGDYVDRGNFSLECITFLFAFKVICPDMVYLIRGNHEFDSICSQYGFKNEILNYNNLQNFKEEFIDQYTSESQCNNCYRYTESLYNAFIQAFSYIPICAIVNNTTFCIHGGLSPKLHHIDDINKNIKRPIHSFEECPLLSDLVWSDPSNHNDFPFEENPRGHGYLFNQEAIYNFLKNNSLKRVIRAHQCVHKGVLQHFDDKCITVFSASSYGKFLGNSSSVIQIFQNDDSVKATTFLPLRHLSKSEAIFTKVPLFNKPERKNRDFFSLLHPRLISNHVAASRITPNKNIRQIKRNRCVPLHISTIPLAKPKFSTNSRRSYPCTKSSELFDDL